MENLYKLAEEIILEDDVDVREGLIEDLKEMSDEYQRKYVGLKRLMAL